MTDDTIGLHRSDDPDTSVEAAELIVGKIRVIQKIVLRFHMQAGDGLTDFELEELCGSHGSTYRTRRSELVQMGLIVNSGRRRLINGRQRIVWIAISKIQRPVSQLFRTDHLERIQYRPKREERAA